MNITEKIFKFLDLDGNPVIISFNMNNINIHKLSSGKIYFF